MECTFEWFRDIFIQNNRKSLVVDYVVSFVGPNVAFESKPGKILGLKQISKRFDLLSVDRSASFSM